MQCFICGEQMRVVLVEPHVVDMQGFELRTFQCVGCGDTEKRPVFDGSRSPREVLSKTVAPPPETPFEQAALTMSPMALSFWQECRRVKNDKLKRELGVSLRYPTYREGLKALFAERR